MVINNRIENEDVAILVASCDAFSDLWHTFFACFFKYWPDCPYPVYLGSNRVEYADQRVRSILIGEDIDYSSNLMKMINQIPQGWIILWVDDRVLSSTVDTRRMKEFVSFSHRKNAGYTKLISTHPFSLLTEEGPGIGEIPKGKRYRFGITVGLWRKRLLMELLSTGESAWQLERFGCRRADAMEDTFYALHYKKRFMPPLQDKHLVMKGKVIRDALQFLKKEGCDGILSHRPVQSIGSFLYMKIYISVWDSISLVRWWWKNVVGIKLLDGFRAFL